MRRGYKIAAVAFIGLVASRADAAVHASDAFPIIIFLLFSALLFGGFLLIYWGRYSRDLRAQRDLHRREILERSRQTREREISGRWAPTTIQETRAREADQQRRKSA